MQESYSGNAISRSQYLDFIAQFSPHRCTCPTTGVGGCYRCLQLDAMVQSAVKHGFVSEGV